MTLTHGYSVFPPRHVKCSGLCRQLAAYNTFLRSHKYFSFDAGIGIIGGGLIATLLRIPIVFKFGKNSLDLCSP